MERVQVLIDKLMQQARANESATQLLYTVQLLQSELLQLQKQKEPKSTRKVAVVLPANFAAPQQNEAAPQPAPIPVNKAPESTPAPQPIAAAPEKEIYTLHEEEAPEQPAAQPANAAQPVAQAPMPEVEKQKPAPQQRDLFSNEAYTIKRPAIVEPEAVPPQQPVAAEQQPQPPKAAEVIPPHPVATPQAEPQPFDAIAETPTLVQHLPPQTETPKEINQLVNVQQPSLNDRLKQERPELAHKLKDAPIKDLRKAIGINDRFLFVNELFRGDEAMYERSIKTINSFHILPEAEYWMNRELKVKLGWDDNKDTVQYFYSLVRRRFS